MLSGLGVALTAFGAGQAVTAFADWVSEDDWTQTIKDNVKTLLEIPDLPGADGKNVLALTATLTSLGVGIAAFGIGQTTGAVAQALTKFTGNEDWATKIKDNTKTLLEIPDLKNATFGNIASFPLTMASLGAGLIAFSVGQAVSGIAAIPTIASDSLDKFSGAGEGGDWATKVKDNVETLLEIPDLENATLGNLASFPLIMASLGLGLIAFSAGQATAGIASVPTSMTDSIDKFSGVGEGGDWATKIKDNVKTLLEIPDLKNATLGNLVAFPAIMATLALGLAAFAVGKGVEGVAEAGSEGLEYFTGEEEFADRIKREVKTLLEIPSLPGVAADTAGFIAVMGGIALGLAAFSIGKAVEGASSGLQAGVSAFTTGEEFADRIKREVTTLLSIPSLTSEGEVETFKTTMETLGDALSSFGGSNFVGALANAGAAVLGFFSGSESPFEQIRIIANNADELEKGAAALVSLESSLDKIGQLSFDGSDLGLEDFAEDLAKSVPVIEKAIMGGTIEKFGLYNDIDFKGLASPDINYDDAIRNITALRGALGFEVGNATAEVEDGERDGGGGAAIAPTTVNNTTNNNTTNNYYNSTSLPLGSGDPIGP